MKKRIAVIVEASIYNQKGLFLAVHNRIINLSHIAEYEIDPYLISPYKPKWLTFICKEESQSRPDTFTKDNIAYRIIWYKNNLIDYILYHKFKFRKIFKSLFFYKIASRFSKYDLINSHSGVGELSYIINKKYGIPFVTSWHGSDIHTTPAHSEYEYNATKKILESSKCNFFVSKGLLNMSNKLTENDAKVILYNGCSTSYKSYSLEHKTQIRERFNTTNKKVIAFVGNLIPIKNPLLLPEIFSSIYSRNSNVEFWIIGNGTQKSSLEVMTRGLPIKFWGNIDSNEMPDYYNSIDVVILPSKNEGLPLVCLEALSCGCNMVGSDVGGISEVIGTENVFPHGPNFTKEVADRVLFMLSKKVLQPISPMFDWKKTALIENDIIVDIIKP